MTTNFENSLLTTNQCNQILIRKLKNDNFRLLNYKTLPVSEANKLDSDNNGTENLSDDTGGYIGEHYILKATIFNNISKKEENYRIFLKLKMENPNGEWHFAVIATELCKVYESEVTLYTLVDNNLDVIEKLPKWCPEFYGIYNDRVIAIEDLSELNFQPSLKMFRFDFAHYEVLLKKLATMHAFSIQLDLKLKETGKNLLDLYPDTLVEYIWSERNEESKKLVHNIKDNMFFYLFKQLEKPKVPLDKLEQILNKQYNIFLNERLKPSSRYLNCVNHGDLWGNNIVFKYDNSSQPVDCRLLDFQTVRYIPPVLDVLVCIYLNSTLEFQQNHQNHLLNFYYEQLEKEVKNLSGKELNKIFSKEDFDKACEEYILAAKFIAYEFKITLNIKDVKQLTKEYDYIFVDASRYLQKYLDLNDNNYREYVMVHIEDLQDTLIKSDQ